MNLNRPRTVRLSFYEVPEEAELPRRKQRLGLLGPGAGGGTDHHSRRKLGVRMKMPYIFTGVALT